MEKVFFDTNIYNHIDNSQFKLLKNQISEKKLEIYTIPQVLAELAGTFKKDKALSVKYCNTYKGLINECVLQPPPVLLKAEIGYVLNKSRKIIYLEGSNKNIFIKYVEDFVEGAIDSYTQEFTERIKFLKKEQLAFLRLGYSKIEPLIQKDKVEKYPTFNSFLKEGIKRKERLKEIERYITQDLGSDAHKAAKFIEKRLIKMPHLKIALRINPALTYYYHVMKKKPKHGDIFDCGYFVCLATIDTFVSDDDRARELFKLICPQKETFSLSDFINHISSL